MCDGCFGVSFVAVYVGLGCVGGVLLWLVVSFLCDVVGAGGFSGNRVSSCSWWWALGSLSVVIVLWGVTGVFGIVDVMDRGYAIKFSYGRAVVSVVVRFYRGGFAVNIL